MKNSNNNIPVFSTVKASNRYWRRRTKSTGRKYGAFKFTRKLPGSYGSKNR